MRIDELFVREAEDTEIAGQRPFEDPGNHFKKWSVKT